MIAHLRLPLDECNKIMFAHEKKIQWLNFFNSWASRSVLLLKEVKNTTVLFRHTTTLNTDQTKLKCLDLALKSLFCKFDLFLIRFCPSERASP